MTYRRPYVPAVGKMLAVLALLVAASGVSEARAATAEPFSKVLARFESEDLSITPVMQQSPVWCWLAVGEMVFEHYDVPNVNPAGIYQCGIIGALAGPMSPCWRDCRYCSATSGGSMQNISYMISRYPQLVRQLTGNRDVKQLRGQYRFGALSAEQIKEELDAGRPIIAGINPSGYAPAPGQSMHVALIVGYDEDDDKLTLTVNDPFPYDIVAPGRNPFAAAGGDNNGDGSYSIEFRTFKRNLNWNASIAGIE